MALFEAKKIIVKSMKVGKVYEKGANDYSTGDIYMDKESKKKTPDVQVGQVIDKAVIVNTEKLVLPKENKYAEAARWVRKMKDTRDFIRESNNNMEELARILSPIFGWQVEGHQLKKALYRNQ